MASRTIHCAIAKLTAESYPVRDCERFTLGELLPDAYAENRDTADSHLKISLMDGEKKTYDLDRFRSLFARELETDDLYRGYYLHLVQDLHFRRFVYHKHNFNPRIPGNIQRLHRDYSMINPYVIESCGLENRLCIPPDFASERINILYPYWAEQLAADFASDFAPVEAGEYFFFTPQMADEFIALAAEHSVAELTALDTGGRLSDMRELAWNNRK